MEAAQVRPTESLTDRAGTAAGQETGASSGDVLSSPRLVLVIDQFEELFTQRADEPERKAFIRALCAAAGTGAAAAPGPGRASWAQDRLSSRDAPALVVVGVRADFYARSAVYPELVPYLQADVGGSANRFYTPIGLLA